jgi:hypothetical protein
METVVEILNEATQAEEVPAPPAPAEAELDYDAFLLDRWLRLRENLQRAPGAVSTFAYPATLNDGSPFWRVMVVVDNDAVRFDQNGDCEYMQPELAALEWRFFHPPKPAAWTYPYAEMFFRRICEIAEWRLRPNLFWAHDRPEYEGEFLRGMREALNPPPALAL